MFDLTHLLGLSFSFGIFRRDSPLGEEQLWRVEKRNYLDNRALGVYHSELREEDFFPKAADL